MSLRYDICCQRGAVEKIEQELVSIEQRLASRNTAHLIDRARSMLRATSEILGQALSHSTEERAPTDIDHAPFAHEVRPVSDTAR